MHDLSKPVSWKNKKKISSIHCLLTLSIEYVVKVDQIHQMQKRWGMLELEMMQKLYFWPREKSLQIFGTFFKLIGVCWQLFIFIFLIGYIFGHFALLGKTKW